jgi:hypothetical protein
VPVSVVLEGIEGQTPEVWVHYKVLGAKQYQSERLTAGATGRYTGYLPASAATALGINYYIQVVGPGEAYRMTLGSPRAPFGVDVLAAANDSWTRAAAVVGAVCAAAMLLACTLVWRDRRRRHRLMDEIFWVRTLMPLRNLQGHRLTERLTRLSRMPMEHPTKGITMFSRNFIWKKLEETRRVNLAALRRDRRRFLGEAWEPAAVEAPPERKPAATPTGQARDRRVPATSA